MKKFGSVILIGIACVAVNWLVLLAGWWWFTPILGLSIGLSLRPTSRSFLTSFCVSGLSWGLPLTILAMNAPIKSVASAVESVVGLSSTGGVLIIGLTVTFGCILSMVGTWVGVAVTQLLKRI